MNNNIQEDKYRIFYINDGKFFVSVVENGKLRQSITKYHKEFKTLCLWFTEKEALKFIKENRHHLESWYLVDISGVQKEITWKDKL